MKEVYIKSVSEVHEFLGLKKPRHPLITVFSLGKKQYKILMENFKYSMGLYQVSIKGNCAFTLAKYGRNTYDFQECSMIFTSPNQTLEFNRDYKTEDDKCWSLFFHPDLIRKSPLAKTIERYSFFSYSSYEALHLSDVERKTLTDIAKKIEIEYQNNIDAHSQTLIISNLELLLNYCARFYDRQFYTRTNFDNDTVADFEYLLKEYYNSNKQMELGIPSVQYFGEAMNMSPKYLSDMLRKKTDKGAQEHIYNYVIEKAKNQLSGTESSASEIAYALGFEYPQYFSKMFKKKTKMSPKEYRQSVN